MDMSYCFYMAEAEGLLPTRTGKLNAIIKAVKAYPQPKIDLLDFMLICSENGISYSDLSVKELEYISKNIKNT